MHVVDSLGYRKGEPGIFFGLIILFHGTAVPSGWALCDGSNGTPDLRGAVLAGDTAAGSGTSGGSASPDSLTHSGFTVGNHSDHTPTQATTHAAHSTSAEFATHAAHTVTAQADDHPDHSTEGAHTHDSHTFAADAPAAVGPSSRHIGPTTHLSDGGHAHTAHSSHSGFAVTGSHAHSGFAATGDHPHSGFAVDAHAAHVVGQPSTHAYKSYTLAYIMKL